MRAARFHGRGDIRVDEVPEPVTGPGQVMIDVEWCGICGTDLHEFLEGPIFIPSSGAPHELVAGGFRELIDHERAHVKILVHP